MSSAICFASGKLRRRAVLRRRQPGPGEDPAECAALLGEVDRLRARADDRDAGVLEPPGEPERGLPAELDDNADDLAGPLLGVHDLEDVLEGERLEVEPVARVVVGRHRLGVAVDHDGLEPCVAQGERGVHARVVELDALTDPVRTRAEDDHLAPAGRGDLVLLVVGRVVVRRRRGELGRARVDRLVDRPDAERVPDPADDVLGHAAQPAELGVGEPVPLGLPEQLGGERLGVRDLRRRPRREGRAGRGTTGRSPSPRAAARCSRPRGRPAAPGAGARRSAGGPPRASASTSAGGRRRAVPVEGRAALLQRAQGLLERFGEVAADGHRLADALHRGRERGVGRGELLEGEPRHLDDDVVEGRLEARRGLPGDVVGDLVEGVADGEPGGDLRDREPGRLATPAPTTATRAGSSR